MAGNERPSLAERMAASTKVDQEKFLEEQEARAGEAETLSQNMADGGVPAEKRPC